MSKKHTIHPPIENRRVRFRRFIVRWAVNILVFFGAAVLYYLAFSFFFDTPAEDRLKERTVGLRREYKELTDRMAELEKVLDNVVERDRNVFRIIFESEPYETTTGYEASRWELLDNLQGKTNNELNDMFTSDVTELGYRLQRLDEVYTRISETMERLGDSTNDIPAIQPVINNELTLLTASFGMRIHPFHKMLTQHNGVDFTVEEGSRVFATADGTVAESFTRSSSTGRSVEIDHGNGYKTVYNHLDNVLVRKGQQVRRGDIIALSGNTGLSLVPHLHYEVHYNGQPVDPVHYFFMELSPSEYRRIINIARSGMQSFD